MLPLFKPRSKDANGALNVVFRPAGGLNSTNSVRGPESQGWANASDPALTRYAYVELAPTVLPSTAVRTQGLAFTPDGALYVANTAPDSTSTRINGIAIRADGALHVTSSASAVGALINGTALSASGQIILSSAFILPLSDSGAGVVNTVPLAGTGSATFTRASVAETVLSNGLQGQVSTGTPRSIYSASGIYLGYYSEAAGTQLVTPTASIRDMTNAAWTLGATMTAEFNQVGADGAVSSATLLTGGAVAATNTAFQTLVAAASSRTYSALITRVTGTGIVNITQNAGTAYTDITAQLNTIGFVLVQLTGSLLNAAFGIQVVTSGDQVRVDMNQFEAGAFATSRMLAAGAARAADVLSYPTAGNTSTTAMTVLCTYTPIAQAAVGGSIPIAWSSYLDANNWMALYYNAGSSRWEWDRDVSGTTKSAILSVAYPANGTSVKVLGRQGPAGLDIWVNGVKGTGDATVTTAVLGTAMAYGAYNSLNQPYAAIKDGYIWQQALPDAVCAALST